ncbi:MAG: hypothetical protein U1E78_10100 [Gammaproteobacteria bacterium]
MSVMKTQPAFAPLSHMGFLLVEGPQAESFLQGQLTIDIKKVSVDTLLFGGYCNLKGRLHSLFYVTRLNQEHPLFLLTLPLENLSHLMTTLKKFALFSKVTIKEVTTDWRAYGLWHYSAESSLKIYPISQTRSLLIEPLSHQNNIESELKAVATVKSPQDWMTADIESQHPWILKGGEEIFLPHHVNLPQLGGVDFKKGCYVGQEIVARMEYLGKHQRGLHTGKVSTCDLILPGAPIHPGGTVVMSISLDSETQAVLTTIPDATLSSTLKIYSETGPILSLN